MYISEEWATKGPNVCKGNGTANSCSAVDSPPEFRAKRMICLLPMYLLLNYQHSVHMNDPKHANADWEMNSEVCR